MPNNEDIIPWIGSYNFLFRLVCDYFHLNDIVLLQCKWNILLHLNALCSIVNCKFIVNIFTSIICC
jgi:hypothetical protein